MPTWRDSLPVQSDSIDWSFMDALMRTDMEIGPPKTRLRSTKARSTVRIGGVLFTKHQVDEFHDFWDNDIGGGALAFTWPVGHPLSDANASFQFLSRPSFTMLGGGDTNERRWMATLELEML